MFCEMSKLATKKNMIFDEKQIKISLRLSEKLPEKLPEKTPEKIPEKLVSLKKILHENP